MIRPGRVEVTSVEAGAAETRRTWGESAVQPVLRLCGLHHELVNDQSGDKYTVVIDELNLPSGGFVSILGGSGCGKTTLLTLLGLARKPFRTGAGSAVESFDIYETPQEASSASSQIIHWDIASRWRSGQEREIEELRRRLLGFCLQSGELLSSLTVEENVSMPLALNGHRPEDTHSRVDELLVALSEDRHLLERKQALPSQLSGGQYQRVALARSIAHRPQVVFVDEPTGNLDAKTARKALDLLSEMQRESGLSVVMITHDRELAREYASYIVHMGAIREKTGSVLSFERKTEDGWVETDCRWSLEGEAPSSSSPDVGPPSREPTQDVLHQGRPRVTYPFLTGMRDAMRSRRTLVANAFIVAGICLPILLLLGLKRGLVEQFRADILKSPTAREVKVWVTKQDTAIGTQREAALESASAGIDLVIPDITKVALLSDNQGRKLSVTLNATKSGDPFLRFYEADVLGAGVGATPGILLSRHVATSLEIPFEPREAKGFRLIGEPRLVLEVQRMESSGQGRQQVEVLVRGVFDTGREDQAVAYLDRDVMDRLEDFSQGRSVEVFSWPGSEGWPDVRYDGYLAFCKSAYGGGDLQRLHLRGFRAIPLDGLEDAHANDWRDLYGLLKPHPLHVYWIRSGTSTEDEHATVELAPVKVEEITDADDVILPWSRPRLHDIDGQPHWLVGVSGRGRWLKPYFQNYATRLNASKGVMRVLFPFETPPTETSKGEPKRVALAISENTTTALEVASLRKARASSPDGGIALGQWLGDRRKALDQVQADGLLGWLAPNVSGSLEMLRGAVEELSVQAREQARLRGQRRQPPIAVVPADLTAYLARFEEGHLSFEPQRGQFVPATVENVFYGARVYADSLETVPQVDRYLQEQGYSTLSSKTRVLEMKSYATTLDLLVWIVMAMVLVFGAWTVSLVFSDVTSRKRGAIGIMRIMGMPPSGVFGFVFVRAFVVGISGFLVGLVFGIGLSLLIPVLFDADCRLQAQDFAWILCGALVCSVIGVLIPAWHAARKLDPVEAILQSRIQ